MDAFATDHFLANNFNMLVSNIWQKSRKYSGVINNFIPSLNKKINIVLILNSY